MIDQSFIAKMNEQALAHVRHDYDVLGLQLFRRGIKIDEITKRAQAFAVAIPSWGVGTGGTRFARFPAEGEPRNIFEKLVDCATIHQVTRTTPRVSLHIPWDKPADQKELVEFASHLGLSFDAMNSNTFQDQSGQEWSYKFGSLSHTDPVVRKHAIDHNIECIEIGKALGSKALTVWIGDGGNFPGQIDFRRSLDRYLGSVEEIYAALPADWRLFIEYKLYEPAFYSTVINDWGTAYHVVNRLGSRAFCLVDLGHHAPNVNIEMIVSRLLQLEKLGGFHFNDSKYGDDDLDSGSVKPFQLFLIFHELVNASAGSASRNPEPAYMIDQSHNVTDPIEALVSSAEEIQRAFVQALLVDRHHLSACQEGNDAVMALKALKQAFTTDVSPILHMARYNQGGAIDPIAVFRQSKYRMHKASERPVVAGTQAGIV